MNLPCETDIRKYTYFASWRNPESGVDRPYSLITSTLRSSLRSRNMAFILSSPLSRCHCFRSSSICAEIFSRRSLERVLYARSTSMCDFWVHPSFCFLPPYISGLVLSSKSMPYTSFDPTNEIILIYQLMGLRSPFSFSPHFFHFLPFSMHSLLSSSKVFDRR